MLVSTATAGKQTSAAHSMCVNQELTDYTLWLTHPAGRPLCCCERPVSHAQPCPCSTLSMLNLVSPPHKDVNGAGCSAPLTAHSAAHHRSPPLTTAHHRSPAPILNHPCVHKFNLIRAWGDEGRNARNHTGVARSCCQCVEHSQRRLLLRLSDYHARHASGGVDWQRAVLPPNQQAVWVAKERRGGCRLQRRQMARR